MTLNSRFNNNIDIVIDYLIKNNGIEPRKNEVYEGIRLSKIINKIKTIYINGEKQEDGSIIYDDLVLSKNSLDKLIRINFNFKKLTSNDRFEHNITLLKEYLNENDITSIKKNTLYKNFQLGEWIDSLRYSKKHGKQLKDGSIIYKTKSIKRILTKKEIESLEEIGFTWNTNSYDINTRKEYLEKRRILHIYLYNILKDSKNQIKSKEDVDKLNKKLMKKLD